jgi:putative ABC transport system permease protein
VTGLRLALSTFRRHRLRTGFTVISVAAGFAVFIVLAAIHQGVSGQLRFDTAQRLLTSNKLNNGSVLPVRYAAQIRKIPGVAAVAYLANFNAYFRDPRNTINVTPFSVHTLTAVYPMFVTPPEQLKKFLRDRQGAVVGPALARKMNWKVGQTIPLQGGPQRQNGGTTWTFHLDGIYHTELPEGYRSYFVVHYAYYNRSLADARRRDTVQQFEIMAANPRVVSRVSHGIDSHFENASPQTMTMSERSNALTRMREFGDISTILIGVGCAVFFSMLLIAGNTLANSVRERTSEFAAMRALGFERWHLVSLVLGESVLLVGTGCALGLGSGWMLCRLVAPEIVGAMQAFAITGSAIAVAVGLAVLFALAISAIPARQVSTLAVADALRRS